MHLINYIIVVENYHINDSFYESIFIYMKNEKNKNYSLNSLHNLPFIFYSLFSNKEFIIFRKISFLFVSLINEFNYSLFI